jgi:membrane-associated phospholipid phosphatase
MDALFEFGINLIEWIQSWPAFLDRPMALFTFMGTIEFYLLLIPLIYWAIDPRLGIRTLLILIGVDMIGSYAKQLLHQPRPYWVSELVEGRALEQSYGIPSTHASNTLAVWGALALKFRRNWFTIVTLLLLFLIGLSRLYLGVHFPHDVLGGWLLGLTGLYLFIRFEDQFLAWFNKIPLTQQLISVLAISLGLAGLGLLVGVLISGSPDPESWAELASEARSPAGYFTNTGALFGAVAGYLLLRNYVDYNHQVSWSWRLLRYVAGMIVTLAIYEGLDIIFAMVAGDETMAGYLLHYVRYAAVTLWITLGAPWIFQQWLGASQVTSQSQTA